MFNEVYLDIMLLGLTKAPEFKFTREMHYREEFTSVDLLQETANHFYVNQQSRTASGPVVSGRGGTMAACSSDHCYRCKVYPYFQRDCPKLVQKSRSSRRKKKVEKQARRWWGECSAEILLLLQHQYSKRC